MTFLENKQQAGDKSVTGSPKSGTLHPTTKITNPIERQNRSWDQKTWIQAQTIERIRYPHTKSLYGELSPHNSLRRITSIGTPSKVKVDSTKEVISAASDVFQHSRDVSRNLKFIRQTSAASLPEMFETNDSRPSSLSVSPRFSDGLASTLKGNISPRTSMAGQTLVGGSLSGSKGKEREVQCISSDDDNVLKEKPASQDFSIKNSFQGELNRPRKRRNRMQVSSDTEDLTVEEDNELGDDQYKASTVEHILNPPSDDEAFIPTVDVLSRNRPTSFAKTRSTVPISSIQFGSHIIDVGLQDDYRYELSFPPGYDETYIIVLSSSHNSRQPVPLPNVYIKEVYYFLDKDAKLGEEHYLDIKFGLLIPDSLSILFSKIDKSEEDFPPILRLTFVHRSFAPKIVEMFIKNTWGSCAHCLSFGASYSAHYDYNLDVHSPTHSTSSTQSGNRRYMTRSSIRQVASSSQSLESSPLSFFSTRSRRAQRQTSLRPTIPDLDSNPTTLFSFPPNEIDAITITSNDVLRLPEGYYLNDSLIDFDLRRMYLDALPSVRESVHIFSSFFYRKLSSDSSSGTVSKTDIFDKRFSLVPINEHLHWYLVIISKPLRLLETRSEEYSHPNVEIDLSKDANEDYSSLSESNQDQYAHVIILDSLGSKNRSLAIERIKNFIVREAEARYGVNVDKKNIKTLYPKLPLQDNLTDCGCFLLEYVDRFLQNPETIVQQMLRRDDSLAKWFDTDVPTMRRLHLKELIGHLTVEQNQRDQTSTGPPIPPSASSDIEEIDIKLQ